MATEVVKTIRASGGDYTSLSAWVTGEERDLVTADEIAVAECYDDWPSGLDDQADLVEANWTVDSTRYIKWTVADGHRHNGTPQSGFFIERSSNFDLLFDNDVDHTVIEWLDFTNTASSGSGLQLTGTVDGLIDKCIGASKGNTFNCAGTCCIRNTLAHNGDGDSKGFTGQNFNTDHYFYNCTAVDHDTGFNGFDNSVYINCVAFNCTTDYGSTFDPLSSHNASDDPTASNIPGSDSVAGVVSGDFVDSANADMHLASGSALEDVGTDLSGDANWPFSDDVDGDTRSGTWDIGFDEITVTAKTVTVTITDLSGTALVNETGISWNWRDSFGGVITDSGTNESTDGSGIMTVDVPNSTLTSGQTGYLSIQLSNGEEGIAQDAID